MEIEQLKRNKRSHSRAAVLSKAVSLYNLQRKEQTYTDGFPLTISNKKVENRHYLLESSREKLGGNDLGGEPLWDKLQSTLPDLSERYSPMPIGKQMLPSIANNQGRIFGKRASPNKKTTVPTSAEPI